MPSPFMTEVRNTLRVKRYSYKTEQSYCYWIKYFIRYQHMKHPQYLGPDHVRQFLTYLAVQRRVATSTQNQALNALNFLYKQVLGRPLGDVSNLVKAKKATKIPVVFERHEVNAIFTVISPTHKLPVQLMYGSGLRLMECLRLRIKDIDFNRMAIIVRSGKGNKDRVTILPDQLIPELKARISENGSGASWTQRPEDNPDLHSCAKPWWPRSKESFVQNITGTLPHGDLPETAEEHLSLWLNSFLLE